MNIKVNKTNYVVKHYPTHGWTLTRPTKGINPKTKATVEGTRDTYHANVGQCLAVIADCEHGKARTINELRDICQKLRADFLATPTKKLVRRLTR